MADESTVIRQIYLHPINSTVDDVMRLLRDLKPTEKIHLVLHFTNSDRSSFSDIAELRELVLVNKSQIQYLEVIGSFEFLVQFLLANSGETKHFRYSNYSIPMQLEHAAKLSNAIRSNINNGNIESFIFSGCYDSSEVFQPVWDALLATGVQQIKLFLELLGNNDVNGGNKFDVSNISTNTSLKELQVDITLCGTNLFDSIKGNTTVEKLILNEANLDNKGKKAFIEMLLENTTLIHVELLDSNLYPILREEINVHTTVNQIWKRLLIVKRKERMAAAATAAISSTGAIVAINAVDDANVERRKEQDNNVDDVEKKKKMAEENKMMEKKKEMNLWLKTFEKKPVLCNELIYLFLTENAGDRYNTNHGTSSIVVGKRRKRKRHNNDGTI